MPGLNQQPAGTEKPADDFFAGGEGGDEAGIAHLQFVAHGLGPGDQVAVIDDLLLARLEIELGLRQVLPQWVPK